MKRKMRLSFSEGKLNLQSPLSHTSLILRLVHREIIGRYRGSLLGLVWAFLTPLFMLGIYTLVFSTIFKAKWGIETDDAGTGAFAVLLFSGLIVHSLFGEITSSVPSVIRSNVNYVKKVVFPLEILPIASLGAGLFHMMVSFGVLLIFEIFIFGKIPLTIVALPLVILPFAVMLMGLGWFLASLGVYLQDIQQITGPIVTAMLFLSPVFYPLEQAPAPLRPFLMFNPLTLIINQTREVMIYGHWPDFWALTLYGLIAALFAGLGYWWFQKTRNGFADVL